MWNKVENIFGLEGYPWVNKHHRKQGLQTKLRLSIDTVLMKIGYIERSVSLLNVSSQFQLQRCCTR